MGTTRVRAWMAVGVALVAVGSGTVAALAAIPDAGGTISACFKTNSGGLRVIDVDAESCKNAETPIQWNQTGASGPQGPKGDPGRQGRPGPAGDNIFAIVASRFVDPDILVGVTGNHVVAGEAVGSPTATRVIFDRDVTGCACAATARDNSLDRIRADRDPLDPNSVLVTTRLAGASNDGFGSFSLIVAR